MSLIRAWVPRLGSGADPALHRIKFPFWMRDPGVVGSYKAEVGHGRVNHLRLYYLIFRCDERFRWTPADEVMRGWEHTCNAGAAAAGTRAVGPLLFSVAAGRRGVW